MSGPYATEIQNAAWRKNQARESSWDVHESLDPKSAVSLAGKETMAHPGITIQQSSNPLEDKSFGGPREN